LTAAPNLFPGQARDGVGTFESRPKEITHVKVAPMNETKLNTVSQRIELFDDSGLIRDERAVLVRMTIGDLIRTQRTRTESRVTQEELAYRSAISFEHLNHIENYRAKASIEVLDRVALALGFRRLSELLALDHKGIL
jgi:hypothetical protein